MRKQLTSGMVLAMALAAVESPAQAPQLDVYRVDASGFPEVRASIELRLPSGELADSLSAAALRVAEGDRLVSARVVDPETPEPTAYLFVVDVSGSMKAILPSVRAAVQAFVDGLGERDRAAIVAFHDEDALLHPFTADRAALAGNLDRLQPAGKSTQLYRALMRSSEALTTVGLPERRVVVVISDGHDEGTAYTLDDAIEKVRGAGASVVALGVTSGDPKYLLNLERMAAKSKGLFLRVEPGAAWTEKVALVARHVGSRFVVQWTSGLATDGSTSRVRLEAAMGDASVNADLEVTAPLVEPPPPWWKTPAGMGGLAAAVVVLAVVSALFVRSRHRRRAEMEELKGELERERQQRADVEKGIGQGLEEVKGKLQDLERPAAAPAAAPAPMEAAPAKRRTVFVSGAQPAPTRVPPPPYASALLEVSNGPLAGSKLPLPPGRCTLGRDDVNQIVVLDDKASSQHAVIAFDGGRCVLEDVGSTNGTFVDEQRLSGAWVLADGERVRLGGTTFVFRGR